MSAPENIRVWHLGGLSFWQLIKRTAVGWRDCQLSAKCAQFAYYSMLALVPLLILTIAAIARLPLAGTLVSFERLLRRTLPPDAYELVELQIQDIHKHSDASLVFVALFVFSFGGMRLFVTMGEGLSAVFGAEQPRRWISAQGLSLLLTLGILFLLLLALVLLVLGPDLVHWILDALDLQRLEGVSFQAVRLSIVTCALLLCTSSIYCLMPAVKLPWHWLSPGSVTAVVGWMLLSQGLRLYATYFGHYNKTYGALAGVIVLLLWFYLSGATLLLGGLVNGVIYRATAEEKLAESSS